MADGQTKRNWKLRILIIMLLVVTSAIFLFRPLSFLAIVYSDFGDIATLIDRADSLVVGRGSWIPGREEWELFQSSDRSDLDSLRAAFHDVGFKDGTTCGCGGPVIELHRQGWLIGRISFVHGEFIRIYPRRGTIREARIADMHAEALLKWFDDRKIIVVRQEYEAAILRGKESRGH